MKSTHRRTCFPVALSAVAWPRAWPVSHDSRVQLPTTTCNSPPAHVAHHAPSLLPSASATSSHFFPSPFPAALTINPLNPFTPASMSALGSTQQIMLVDTQRIDFEEKEKEVQHASKTFSLGWNSIPTQLSFRCHSIILMLFTAIHFYLLSSNVCFCCQLLSKEVPASISKTAVSFHSG